MGDEYNVRLRGYILASEISKIVLGNLAGGVEARRRRGINEIALPLPALE